MLVNNAVRADSRVIKSALSLARAGAEVVVLGVAGKAELAGEPAHDLGRVVGGGDEMRPDRMAGIDGARQAGVEGTALVRLGEDPHRALVGGGRGGHRI